MAIAQGPKANLFGAIWMIAAMGAFAIEDSLLKAVAKEMPYGQVLMAFGLGGVLLFWVIGRLRNAPLLPPGTLSMPMFVRAFFEIMGRLFYCVAIVMIPLSTATVILQAAPLVVVAGAALLFGEQVGWRRWSAIGLGLAGVLLILQPGTDGFDMLSLLAVAGMIGLAGRDLASRAAPSGLGTLALGLTGFGNLTIAGALFAFWDGAAFVMPSAQQGLQLALIVAVGAFAYAALMRAMRTGDVSAVTPFRYTRLIFGVVLGVVFFGESLTGGMLAGSALIVASGLFILWRSKS